MQSCAKQYYKKEGSSCQAKMPMYIIKMRLHSLFHRVREKNKAPFSLFSKLCISGLKLKDEPAEARAEASQFPIPGVWPEKRFMTNWRHSQIPPPGTRE